MASPAKKRKSKVVEEDAAEPPTAATTPVAGFNAAAGAGAAAGAAAAAGPKQVKVEGKAATAGGSDEKRAAIARAAAVSNESTFTPEMLRVYYARLYPVKLMFEWLRYGDALSNGESDVFRRREWSFTLRDDIYIRFLSFATEETFHKALLDKLPFKIDIGAIYNAPPTMKDSLPRFAPESKEVVFDVDITDYDSIRMCGCKEAAVCDKCWSLMTAAILTTDAALRSDFGFENILWVFSGRRGVHCWVCDPRARTLSNDARTALIEYLSVYMGNEKNRTLNLYYPLPPSLQRAYDLLEPLFVESYIKQQGLLDSNEGRKRVLDFFEDPKVAEKVEWSASCKTGLERWNQLVSNVDKVVRSQKNPRLRSALHKLVFTYQYPRLDVNVSKNMNHLLKAPWCIHPKTGKVCVPIDPQQAELFSPNRVPTLWQLHEELNAPAEAGAPEVGGVWRRTSLKPHIEFFVSAFLKPLMATFPRERGPAKGGVEMQF